MYLCLQKCISVKSYTDDFRLVYKLGCAPSTVKPKIKKFIFKLWYLYNRVQQYNKNKVWFFKQICSGANCCSTDLCNNHSSKKRSTKKRNPKTQGLILSLDGLLWYNHSVTFSLSSYWFDYIDMSAFSRRQTLSAACADVDNLACTLLFTSNTDICQNDCIANVICPRLCGKCSEFNIFF